MRVLKTALISLVTTTVLLPLPLIMVGALRLRRHEEFLVYVQARSFLIGFIAVFGAIFVLTWFLLGRTQRPRNSQ